MGSKRDKLKRAVRNTVKWGGTALTLVLVVVWIGSILLKVIWVPGRGVASIEKGQIKITGPLVIRQPPDLWANWSLNRADGEFRWWFRYERLSRVGGPWFFGAPLWPPALLSLFVTALAWRADAKYLRRARNGACPACGYDRAGLAPGTVCPECGALRCNHADAAR